jgi:hypothetical protein
MSYRSLPETSLCFSAPLRLLEQGFSLQKLNDQETFLPRITPSFGDTRDISPAMQTLSLLQDIKNTSFLFHLDFKFQ